MGDISRLVNDLAISATCELRFGVVTCQMFFICSPCQDLHGTSARESWGMVTNILVTMEHHHFYG
jgi:hypothetical protein